MMRRTAVFLDKDGTLIEDMPYNVDVRRMRILPGVISGLRQLQQSGLALIVVTNQAGIALGKFTESQLLRMEHELRVVFHNVGVKLQGFYYCPHHPLGVVSPYDRNCECRKPSDGLLRRASQELNLDLESSWMVGDILHDVEAGRRAGCRTVLIDNGNETEWKWSPQRKPHFVARDFEQAARLIMRFQSFRGNFR